MNKTSSRTRVKNHILASLPNDDRDGILLDLQPVSLRPSQVLYEMGDAIDYVYFANSGMCSLISYTKEGETLEVGIVGYDGMVGLTAFFGDDKSQHRVIVQGAGDALRMRVGAFRQAVKQVGSFQSLILRYVQVIIAQLTQSAVCNRFHPIEGRLCRWLLLSQDAVRSNELELTQEFIAYMLGVRRAGVTVAAGAIQSLGLISYNRGHITILDREGLEDASCECYAVVSDAINKYLSA